MIKSDFGAIVIKGEKFVVEAELALITYKMREFLTADEIKEIVNMGLKKYEQDKKNEKA